MSDLVDTAGKKIHNKVPKVVDVEPIGSKVLIEHIPESAMVDTTLILDDDSMKGSGPPQAYIKKVGNKFDADDWGFNVGSRVVLTGSYTPIMDVQGEDDRHLGIIEPSMVKAVLKEASKIETS